MAYKIGDTITPTSEVATGKAPGQENFSYGRLSPTAPGKVIGTRNVNGQNYYNIDQTGIGGGTGWVNAAAVDAPASPTPSSSYSAPVPSSPQVTAQGTPRLDFIQAMYQDFQKQDAERAKTSAAARDKLINYYSTLEDPTARLTRLRDENGVGAQQELVDALMRNVMDTENNIDDLEGSVNERSKDFLINDAGRVAMLAREREPLLKSLTKLLGQKQREEIGLSGKQALVSQLLDLSFKNDQMRAEPLKMGVDFTESDRKMAQQVFSEYAGRTSSAISADISDQEQSRRDAENRDFQKYLTDLKYQQDIAMENLQTDNAIRQSNATKSSSTAKSKVKEAAENEYNKIMGNSKSESEVWQKIYNNRNKYAELGIIDELWNLHGAFKASLQGRNIREDYGL